MIEYAAASIQKRTVRSINATDIQRLYNTLAGKSHSYISKFCSTIRGIFRAAVQDGVIIRSPAELAQPPKGTAGEHRCLERWEQDLVVSTYAKHDFGICAMTMLFAGLRRGEIINLNVDRDVDFVKKTITVRGASSFSEGNQATVTEGKTKAAQRVIPLNDCLATRGSRPSWNGGDSRASACPHCSTAWLLLVTLLMKLLPDRAPSPPAATLMDCPRPPSSWSPLQNLQLLLE